MGSIVPIAFQALQAFQAVSTVAKVIDGGSSQGNQAVSQLQERQALENRQATQKAALDKKEISIKAEKAEKERRAALKRAVARKRVRFGSHGVSVGDGSSEAVLLGLFDESEDVRIQREKLDKIRLQSIEQNVNNTRRVNTLERTQLREKEKLKRTSETLDSAGDLLRIF